MNEFNSAQSIGEIISIMPKASETVGDGSPLSHRK